MSKDWLNSYKLYNKVHLECRLCNNLRFTPIISKPFMSSTIRETEYYYDIYTRNKLSIASRCNY